MKRLLEQDAELRRIALRTPAGFLAIGMGTGLSRFAPGTAGTLLAVPFALLLVQLPPLALWLALAVLWGVGVRLCGSVSTMLGQRDPGNIVWDEMVGFWLAVAVLPLDWVWWAAAFVLFRIFDIVKPWPIRALERRVKGGLGIMLDDLIAAAYAIGVLVLVQRLI